MPRIEFNDTFNLASINGGAFDSWVTQSVNLKHLMLSFTDAIDMKGETAQNMGAYFTEVHGAILDAWKDCIAYYRMVLDRFNRELLEVDSNQFAIIEDDYLYNFAVGIQGFRSRIMDTDIETQRFFSRYNFHLESGRYSGETLSQTAGETAYETNCQIERMGELDYRFASEAYAEVERMLDNIEFICSNSVLVRNCGTFYTSGFFESLGAHNLLKLSDDAVARMVEGFFVGHCAENGINNHSILSLSQLLARNPNTLSNAERQVLLLLMADTRVTYYNMAEAFAYASLRRPTRVDDTMSWLNDEFSAKFFGLFEDNRFERSGHLSESELAELLRRAQLITFLNALTPRDMPFRFNFDNFTDERDPTIGFNGTNYRVSDMGALIAGNYLNTNWRRDADDELTAAQIEAGLRNLWDTHGLKLIWTAVGYVPHPFVKAVHKGVSTTLTLGAVISDLAERGIILSNADITFMHRMNTYATTKMRGGVASVQTPNGYRTVGTTLITPDAMVIVAGLREQGILSAEQAMEAVADKNHPDHGVVDGYIEGQGDGSLRADFDNRIVRRIGGISIEHASVSEVYDATNAEWAEYQAREGR